jgi:hypothetical protein
MRKRIRRPSPSMVVATIALFVALGGVGFAAIKANSIGPKQIKANAVRAAEIKANAVRSPEVGAGAVGSEEVLDEALTGGDLQDGSVAGADVRDESLGSGKISDGSLNGGDLEDESVGSADVQGLTGGDVQAGTFLGRSVTVQFEQATAALADNTSASYDVHCPDGETALSGGARGDATDSEFTMVTSSRPKISTANPGAPVDGGTFTGWRATVVNPTGGAPPDGDILPEVWVTCSRVP